MAASGPGAIDGNWGVWSPYSTCSVTCGGGSQERTRLCNDPAPENGGADCEGDDTESQICGDEPCPSEEDLKNV